MRNKQCIYIMINFPFLLIVKIGISKTVKIRSKDISKSVPGIAIPVFVLPIMYAYEVEQFIHYTLSFLNIPFTGSGKTEWFFILAAIPAALIALTVFLLEWAVYIGLSLFLLKLINAI